MGAHLGCGSSFSFETAMIGLRLVGVKVELGLGVVKLLVKVPSSLPGCGLIKFEIWLCGGSVIGLKAPDLP